MIGVPLAAATTSSVVAALALGNNARDQLSQMATANSLPLAIVIFVITTASGGVAGRTSPDGKTTRTSLITWLSLGAATVVAAISGAGGIMWLDRVSAEEMAAEGQTRPLPLPSTTLTPRAPVLPSIGTSSPTLPAANQTASPSASSIPSPPESVYTQVPIATLCNNSQAAVYICGSSTDKTKNIGDQVFLYVGEGNGNAVVRPPNWGRILEFPSNTCKDLTVDFVTDATQGEVTIRVIQTDRPAASATTPYNRPGRLSAKLSGSPFFLQYNSTTGRPAFVNGYATCRSASGT